MLENLKKLKDDMKAKDWSICSFIFTYKDIDYVVLVKRFVGEEKRISKYALVRLHFMKQNNLDDDLEIEANASILLTDAKNLREYFNIAYTKNIGDILSQFTNYLGTFIPEVIPNNLTDIEKEAIVKSLSHSDSENPNKKYCFGIMRNHEGRTRTIYNSDKTKILRPKLYDYFANDKTISFCYSEEQEKEENDASILKKSSINS